MSPASGVDELSALLAKITVSGNDKAQLLGFLADLEKEEQEMQDFETKVEEMEKTAQGAEKELESIKMGLRVLGECSTEDQAWLNDASKTVPESKDNCETLKNQNALARQMIDQNIRRVKTMLGI